MFRAARISAILIILCLLLSFGFGQKSKVKQLTPTINGSTGLFHVPVADTLRQGEFSFSLKGNKFNREPGDIDITRFPVSFTAGLHDRIELFVSYEVYKRVHADQIAVNTIAPGGQLLPTTLPNGQTAYFNDTPFLDTGFGDGSSDVWVGLKFNVLSQRKGAPFSVALQPQIRMHTTSDRQHLLRGLTPGQNDYGFDLIASRNVGWVTVTGSTGVMMAQDWARADRQNLLNWGGGVAVPLGSSHKLYFIGELLGTMYWGDRTTGLANPKAPIDFYAGLRGHPAEWITIGGAYGAYKNRIDPLSYGGIDATGTHGWFAEVSFHRKINEPPTVACSVSPSTIIPSQTAKVTLDIDDPDDDDLTVTWKSNGGQLDQQGESAVFNASGVDPGNYTVIAEVSDGDAVASCSAEITVNKDKQAPVVSCEPGKTSVTIGSSTTLRADASDPNGDALTYAWSVDGQSVPNNSPSFEFGTAGRDPGAFVVRVTVTDVDGMSASCEHQVTATRRPNNNPNCGSLSLSKRGVFAGETITASLSASDPDGDRLTHSWSVDGRSQSGNQSSLSINTSGFAGGSHTATATARDDRGATCTASATFSVTEKTIIQMEGTRADNVAKAQLDEIALKMQQNPRLKAIITGHTDARGSESANQRLGLRRAEALKSYLVQERGIDPGRIDAASAGESLPIADNETAEGRKANRRGEVELQVP